MRARSRSGFPGYAVAAAPAMFELEAFEERRAGVPAGRRRQRRFGDPERWEFETTIAAVVAHPARMDARPLATRCPLAERAYSLSLRPHEEQHPDRQEHPQISRHPHEQPAELLVVQRREAPGARRRRVPRDRAPRPLSVMSAATSCIGMPTRNR